MISVDTKKKEHIGNFKNAGGEYRPKKQPRMVLDHDFSLKKLGKIAPYGVYSVNNKVGTNHDTSEFAGRRPSCCLITMIDDATNQRLALFFEEETTAGAMTIVSLWIRTYGIPQALYGDKKNAFVLTREPKDAELLAGITKQPFWTGR